MKFVCTQENLSRGLAAVSRVAGKNTTLPILSNVLIKTERGAIVLAATNLELAVSARVRGKIQEEGTVTAQARLLTDYVGLQETEQIEVVQDGNNLIISSKDSRSRVLGAPSTEFPVIPQVERKNGISLPAADLRQALAQTVFAAAQDETRPEISGLFLAVEDKKITLAATDSYRLAERTIGLVHTAAQPVRVIIPARAAAEVLRLVPADGEAMICLTENQVLFSFGDLEIVSRLVEGQYPDYQPIIPKNHETEITIVTQDLVQHLKAASLFCAPGMNDLSISVDPKDNKLITKAASSQSGEQESTIDAKVSGQANTIVLNYRYLLDGLSAIGSAQTVLGLTTATSPALLRPADSAAYQYLIMPIRQ